MKVTYSSLNKFFDGKLPSVERVANALTFHSWEIDGIEQVGEDTVLDIKVLPDKSAWALSVRGIAKDLSVILNMPLAHDPLSTPAVLQPVTDKMRLQIHTDACTRYTASYIVGVKVGPSPVWLQKALQALGQRSINNVVDITNYVMFELGQPLHAFDAQKLSHDGVCAIAVRAAKKGESIVTLTGEWYTLEETDTLIVDGGTDTPIGIAGIKGGKHSEVDTQTTDILLESAHFNPVSTRKTSQRLKLRTDASQRFENGVVQEMTAYGLQESTKLICEITGGTLVGYVDTNPTPLARNTVSVTVQKINSVLGLSLELSDVEAIIQRFGYAYIAQDDVFTITSPFERRDLVIAEDVIEEIGRVYGYEHVAVQPIVPIPLREINKSFFYAEQVRDTLLSLGFSEVLTSSFRSVDEVKIANAFASDKGYLRSVLHTNVYEALLKNAQWVELFGSDKVRIFEIGTVFSQQGETFKLAFGVCGKAGVNKKDFVETTTVYTQLLSALGCTAVDAAQYPQEGIIEIDLGTLFAQLPQPTTYTAHTPLPDVSYKPFSLYPHMTRDIAFWTPADTSALHAQKVITEHAGALTQRIDMFDRFEKEGRVSYGFRIVFQSYKKTLTAEEVDAIMQTVSSAISECGWVVR